MAVRKPKIVFIHPDLGIGGAERLVLDVAVALSEKNDVSFITNHFNKQHAFKELQEDQFRVCVVGSWIPRSIFGIFQALLSYIRMIYLAVYYVFFINKSEKPDLFFVDQIPMSVPFVKWAGGKVIYYCHHPDLLASTPGGCLKRFYRMPIDWLELKGTEMSDVILVNSKYTATVFRKTFPQITKNIYIVYPTISFSYQELIANSRCRDINEIAHLSKDIFVFLSINRFHPAKKLELALDALESAHTKLSSSQWNAVHLIMAGGYDPYSSANASYFTKLVKLCENKNLTAKVTFLKSPSDSLKADLLLRCNCLLYTPVNEHFGIVPLEAMTAGKPVIACNSGGPCETVLDGVTGYLCDPTGDSLADAMCKMLQNGEANEMGRAGENRLRKYFSYEHFSNSINEIINKTIKNEHPSENVIEHHSNVQREVSSPEKQETVEDCKKSPLLENVTPHSSPGNQNECSLSNESINCNSPLSEKSVSSEHLNHSTSLGDTNKTFDKTEGVTSWSPNSSDNTQEEKNDEAVY